MIDDVKFAFEVLPPAVYLAVCLGLVAMALRLGILAWKNAWTIYGIRFAPLANTAAAPGGLLKLRGTAEPTPRRGATPPNVVWREMTRSRQTGTGIARRTESRMVGTFRIADGRGFCTVDAARARVVPTENRLAHSPVIESAGNYKSSGTIYRGDPVFALGRFHRADPRGACELRPAGGVLLVSGASERHATILHAIWLAIQAPPALLCLVLLVGGTAAHLGTYPVGERGAWRSFLEMLRSHPLTPGPAYYHPAYPRGESDKDAVRVPAASS